MKYLACICFFAAMMMAARTSKAVNCGTVVTVTDSSLCFGDSNGVVVFQPNNIPDPYWLDVNGSVSQFYSSDTVQGLLAGQYQYTITDSISGCADTGSFVITGPASPLTGAVSTSPTTCNNGFGWAVVTVTGGTPPYTFLWSNGSTAPVQQQLPVGVYTVMVMDGNGCSLTLSAVVAPTSAFTISFLVTPASCNSCMDGSITAQVVGGTPPYSYMWNGINSTQATATGLIPGVYSFCVTDASGCSSCQNVSCLGPGYQLVSGHVFYDYNGNGSRDSGEAAASNYHVWLTPDSIFSVSSPSDGNYGFYLQNGTYSDSLELPTGWHTTTPSTYAITLSGSGASGLDFGVYPDQPIPSHAIGCLFPPAPRCLTNRTYALQVRNTGWAPASGIVYLTVDTQLTWLNPIPLPDSVSGTTYYWHFDSLNTGGVLYFYMGAMLPAAGAVLNFNYVVYTTDPSGTLQPTDANGLTQVVSCSYDPNDKSVNPSGTFWGSAYIPSRVEMGSPLEYVIRFQNTGNDTAYTVVVRDTIDPSMDISTFQLLDASHPVRVEISSQREVKFTFDPIMLPDSNIDEPASHGHVQYRIRPIVGMAPLTDVNNTAHIYFDSNVPVATNTVYSYYDFSAGIHHLTTESNRMSVSPNPVHDFVNLTFDAVSKSGWEISLIDFSGQVNRTLGAVRASNGKLDLQGFAPGLYLLRATDISTGVSGSEKIVIQ